MVMKFNFPIRLGFFAASLSLAVPTYQAYNISTTPSKYEIASTKLGFNGYTNDRKTVSKSEQQEALLKTFYLAGYFKPESLWADINRVGKIQNPEKVFKLISKAVIKADAHQEDVSKFNAKILRKNLFGKNFDAEDLDITDAMDFLLYIGQHAFDRAHGQERNELKAKSWMVEYKVPYMEAAKTLGLIDREVPKYKEYDKGLIHGASRVGFLPRLIDYDYIIATRKIKVNETIALGGNRELWANIDGINTDTLEKLLPQGKVAIIDIDNIETTIRIGENEERTKEGMEYITSLAQKYNIKLNPEQPFISYATKEECPVGRFPNRIYPNYAEGETQKLTETLMEQDILERYSTQEITIEDSQEANHHRPTTATGARDLATKLVGEIQSGKFGDKKIFYILSQSNNPYIERQALVTQLEFDKALRERGLDSKGYKIIVDGVGFSCKQDVPTVHSELGALMFIKWQYAVFAENIALKRDPKSLLFQTRDKVVEVPSMPDLPEVGLYEGVIGYIQYWFDEYLG